MSTIAIARPEQPLTLDCMESFVARNDGLHLAECSSVQLHSNFQPIYSLAHQRVVGYEALIRPSENGNPLSPLSLFAGNNNVADAIFIDRLCRTVHVRNFSEQAADNNTWLFLNLNPLTTLHGRQYGPFFADLLQRYGIPPHRVVIEILEGQIDDEDALAESVNYYRDMGCLIALDDFGIGHSNFNRIWNISPQIVKLDKTMIDQATNNRSVRRVLPSLVSLIHQAGGLALIEGVETERQAMIALQCDIDFVQGFYFAKPEKHLPAQIQHPGIGSLFNALRQDNELEEVESRRRLTPYKENFFDAVLATLDGQPPEKALQAFLALPNVSRCYYLNELGLQEGENFTTSESPAEDNPRFAPLNDARHAIWARRHYFQRAIAEPGLIQVSRPYVSITGGNLCVTLSTAINTQNGLRVLCGDVLWDDN